MNTNNQTQPGYPSGSLDPKFIRDARAQRDRILDKIQKGVIFDPATVATLDDHLAELGKLLDDYPEEEPAPEPEPVKRPVVVPYYGRLKTKLSDYPGVARKAAPMKKFDYQAALKRKGWA